ncbi:MAG: hypothetical protein GY953_39400 [bacterium]|nr:hypothetical protein [bacterium]
MIGLLSKKPPNGEPYLLPEHVNAAWRIEEGYKALTADAGLRMMRWKPEGSDHRDHSAQQNISAAAQDAINDYDAWVRELTRWRAQGVYGVVVDIVVEGRSINECSRCRARDPRTIKRMLRTGLQIYCERLP